MIRTLKAIQLGPSVDGLHSKSHKSILFQIHIRLYHLIYKFNVHICNLVLYLVSSSIIYSDTALLLLLPCRVDPSLRRLMGILGLQFKFLKHLLNDACNDTQSNANSIEPK